jgi:hypothetical protein
MGNTFRVPAKDDGTDRRIGSLQVPQVSGVILTPCRQPMTVGAYG